MLYISDQVTASLLDPATVRQCVVETLQDQAAEQTGLSDPRSMFLRSPSTKNGYHIKGAYLTKPGVAGFRLAGLPAAGQIEPGMQLLMLSDLKTTAPLALVANEALVGMRVGATIALSVEWLAKAEASSLAIFGTGKLMRAAVRAIHAVATFKTARVVSRSAENAKRFCADMAKETGWDFAVADGEAACRDADVIVAITTADAALIKGAWLKPGSLLIPAGGKQECDEAAILGADRLYLDDWAQCLILGDIAALNRAGKITQDKVTGTIAELASGRVERRGSATERIVAIPQGLTILDVAVGELAFRLAREKGLGQTL